ncbi:MAG: RnfABCDGE type electron transport complex subunit D [Clostridia bacterium]
MKNKLTVGASPHVRSSETTTGIMLDVIIALAPALIAAVIYYGSRAVVLTGVCVGTCVLFEYISRKVMKRQNTVGDLSAIVTGLLLAFNLPATMPLWMAAIGSFIAIVVVKQMFGGIGQNFVNPAISARIILMVSFPTAMATWVVPFTSAWAGTSASTSASSAASAVADAVTAATPMATLADVSASSFSIATDGLWSIKDLLLGNHGGSMGETCALALLCGGIYLILRRVISPIIPCVFVGTTALFMLIVSGGNFEYMLYQVLSGGLLLGAIFMATDYSTSPINFKGKIIFAIGCGLITGIIRYYGALVEGVSFAIILMNIFVPHIENLTRSKGFGFVKEKKVKEVEAK